MAGLKTIRAGATALAVTALACNVVAHNIDESQFKPEDILTRDVAVVGGGAAGTYTAVRIKDQGKTVAVIEQDDHLGGHVNTYTDPATGVPVDFGVVAYADIGGAKDFFARFNVSVESASLPPFQDVYADLNTGKLVPGYPSNDTAAAQTALGTYIQLAAQYNDYYFPGYWNLPADVPEDLALPFGEFVTKYNLTAALPTLWIFVQGPGDILNIPTIFVMKEFGAATASSLLAGSFFTPSSHNNTQLYAAAQRFLGGDVLLSSKVSTSSRDDTGVRLVVNTPTGKKLVKARRLVVAIPPTSSNMYPFDLDTTESTLFSKWQYVRTFAALFTGSRLPDDLVIWNTSPDASPASLHLPKPNFVWRYDYTGLPGLYQTMVIGAPDLGAQSAKELMRAGLRALDAAGTYATHRIDFAAFSDHGPSELHVSREELRAGFLGRLYGLQGRRSTWYTGASWTADYTTTIWAFTETVLPGVLEGL